MNKALLDLDALKDITQADPALERQLVQLFMQTTEKCLSRLALCDAQSGWQSIVHELKGAAANIRARALAEACVIREGEAEPVVYARIKKAYEDVRPLLELKAQPQ